MFSILCVIHNHRHINRSNISSKFLVYCHEIFFLSKAFRFSEIDFFKVIKVHIEMNGLMRSETEHILSEVIKVLSLSLIPSSI